MFIEVNITKPFPNEVKIQDPSWKIYQHVVRFEWQPEFCPDCQQMGHICKRNEEVQGKQQKMQKANGRAQQPAKEWRSKGLLTQNINVAQEVAENTMTKSMEIVQVMEQNKSPSSKNGKALIETQDSTQKNGKENSLKGKKASVTNSRNAVTGVDFSVATQNAFGILTGGQEDKQPPDRGSTNEQSK
uniref:Uncharacterized protein LOC104214842 isoform X1 n=1 Tax=Nicotiana sylvestris TaxID=4096 RepID=A0A1U7VKJ3_NICSY|nr:PREDICTED: uncharacterized protein LOC104214842 isoform X1 [Nicotiana sylvestris]